MAAQARFRGLECLRCRARFDDQRLFTGCPRCARDGVAVNLTVALDLAPLRGLAPSDLAHTPRGLWRFRPFLPFTGETMISLGEGATPLVHLETLGRRLGLARLYAKDESRNPTWSYKDRLCAVAVSHAVALGARVITISSTGNHGASTAAYAARAGLPCVIFTLAAVPDTMKTLMQAYGAAVIACPTSESRWALMREGIERFGWYPTSGFMSPPVGSNPFGIEGYKTLAYEIAEDLSWTAPGAIVVPSAYSDGLFGVWKGMRELHDLGLVEGPTHMVAAETHGPLAHALEKQLEVPEAVAGGSTVAFSIGSRYGTFQGLAALRESGGVGVRTTDEGIFEAQRVLAREEGLFAEPSSAAALAAVMQMTKTGRLDRDRPVVVVLTSSGLKDPAASRTWLPEVPLARGRFDEVLTILEESYGLRLGA